MALARMLSKSISTSAKFCRLHEVGGSLAEFTQALYMLLVAHADDYGRLAGDTGTVKRACYPASPRAETEFTEALSYLSAVGLIDWYAVNDRAVIAIANFADHQKGLRRLNDSKFPALNSVDARFLAVPYESCQKARARTEQNRTEQEQNRRAAPGFGTHQVPSLQDARKANKPARQTSAVRILVSLLTRDRLFDHATDDGDLIEITKQRAAQKKIPYTTATVQQAIGIARAMQSRKRQSQ